MSKVLDLWSGMTGTVLPFAGAAAPNGWLLCYGQAVSRDDYHNLFAAIGTTFGAGDGSTTFNLPDLRGRVPAGKDNMGGTPANRLTAAGAGITGTSLGATGGSQTHTLTEEQMPAHKHSAGNSNGYWVDMPGRYIVNAAGNIANLNNIAETPTAGGGQAHPNAQPTIVLNHIIKI